jgi:hypothetical protein
MGAARRTVRKCHLDLGSRARKSSNNLGIGHDRVRQLNPERTPCSAGAADERHPLGRKVAATTASKAPGAGKDCTLHRLPNYMSGTAGGAPHSRSWVRHLCLCAEASVSKAGPGIAASVSVTCSSPRPMTTANIAWGVRVGILDIDEGSACPGARRRRAATFCTVAPDRRTREFFRRRSIRTDGESLRMFHQRRLIRRRDRVQPRSGAA